MEIVDLGDGYYLKDGKKRKKLYGVGIYDGNYVPETKIVVEGRYSNGKPKKKRDWICPYFQCWTGMLGRCYSEPHKINRPTYSKVVCCEEWLIFSNFKAWMEQQDWEGKQLDKDLLVYQNKIYSPETCVFVPDLLNMFLVKRDACRGDYMLGVDFIKSKKSNNFRSRICNRFLRKSDDVHLGYFSSEESAHKAWQKAKIEIAKEYLVEFSDEPKICKGLQRVIDKIKNDYDNNIETTNF